MLKTKHSMLRRTLSMLLAVVILIGMVPANVFAIEAKSNDYIPGDVNGDGLVNALDVNLVRRHIAGGYEVEINTLAADVNADGYITAKDVTNLRKYIAGGYGVELLRGLERFTVKFETGDGTKIDDQIILEGTLISTLQKPYWAEHIFVGWCYDAELKQPVESDDTVTGNMTLYANWLEQVSLDTVDAVNFASAVDVSTDFAITVLSSDPDMTADDVLAALDADDLTDPNAKDIITVSGTTGAFTVKGNGGFKEGYSYRIALLSDKLTFKDEDASARQYNFTVHRDDVMNLTMQSDIKYLPLSKVSNIVNNGQSVASLDIALYQTDGENVTVTELSKGTFKYTGDTAVKVGDIVCVYEGEIPTNRDENTPKSELGDMAYLEITAVSGNTYTYENAEAEEVLFTPDVLPMPEAADTDNDANTVTIEDKYLDYSADIYSYMNLDSQTSVDVGDFFAFYTGDLGVESDDNAAKLTGYGKITKVKENGNDTTTITYIVVTWDDVEACMDVYTEEEMSAAELLEGMDTSEMESEIEQQAIDSGFAEEAALYLTSLSLATDNFNALSAGVNLEDYKVTLKDGSTVSPEQLKLMSGGNVEVEIKESSVKAKVGKNPTHLGDISDTNADEKGITITLDVIVVFTISSEDSDSYIEIAVTGSFVEEVGVDFGVSAEAVWDWAVIIPYISDIKVSANVDTMNFTGVSFNATMITKGEDSENTSALDIATEIRALLKDMANGGEQSDDTQAKLVEAYSKLVTSDSDWVRVVEYNIVEIKKSVPFGLPLININFSVAFVVDMDAALSVGFDFEYIEGKRHVFTMSIKDRSAYSDTIDLQEKAYQFCFYSMGRIGLKAGIEMNFSISVISASLGSVGFDAGAGAYTNLYGYFFYELHYTESKGKDVQYSGALLIQVGIYLELGLEAKAIGGRYSARANLIDKEWKLYETGRRDNVLDFATDEEDVPEIIMKQFVRQVQLPDSFFNMDYLDLISGEAKQAVYNDWNDPERKTDFRNGENYHITITNDKFTYDPKTNTIAVHPNEDDIKLIGEMIVTWRKQPMSFSSKAITRTISLYWDNLRDGYMIVPYSNGGSYVPMIIKNFEEKVVKPADPEKLGYIFAGWYSDASLTTPYTFPELMPNTDTSVYAKWEARTDIPYTVEHYKENFRSGEYELAETENFKGTTDSIVSPEVKTYVGYVSPAKAEIKVEADGSATLHYYYNLERHNITFDAGRVDGAEVTTESDITYNMKYGATISAPQMAMKGYTFVGWTQDGSTVTTVADTVGTKDLTYTAMWQKNNDTEYRIEYYVQQADGRYTLQHMIKDTTATGKVFTEEYLRSLVIDGAKTADQKFPIENAIVFENMTVKGIVCSEAAVDGSGKTVIKLNYGRMKHTLTFDPNYDGAEPIVKDVFYEAEVIAPQNVTRAGYTFAGWQVAPVTIMPAESLTYKAVWTSNRYTVKFDKDAANATGSMAAQSYTYDEAQNITANGFTREHYSFAGWATQSGGAVVYKNTESIKNLIATDGGVVTLYAVWTPVEYTIAYNANGGTHSNTTSTYNVESETITLSDGTKVGYTFGGWYDNASFNGNAITNIAKGSGGNVTLYAKWVPKSGITYKVEHYKEQLDGSYQLTDTDNLTGTTDSNVTPAIKSYTGFTDPTAKTVAVKADGSLVVVYNYTRNSYTINFDAQGGTVTPPSITAKYGAAITLPTPTKAGYGFEGWYNGSKVFHDATMGAKNLTLTAQWAAGKITYTVNHYQQNVDGNGYTVFNTISGTADMDSKITPDVNTYEGFTSPASATTITIKADSKENVVNYYYTRNQYTVTWNLGIGSADGQSYTTGSVYYGAEVKAPVPAKTGYTFKWNAEPVTTMPAKNLTYTAIWTANTYKVSFNANGGTVESGKVTDRTVAYDATYGTLAVLSKTGYTFDGWYDDNTKVTAETVMQKTGDHTLTAKFTPVTYTLTFNNVVASEQSNPETYTVEDAFALTAPASRIGFTFEGWFDNADLEGKAITKIEKGTTGNKTYYAKWMENTCKVTFHAYNGSTVEETRNILYTGVLGENTFERIGYTFLGWSDGINDTTYGTDTKLSQIVTADTDALHIYAVWEKQKYSITYVGVEADEHDNATEYTVEDMVSLGDPNARTGYTFKGWFDNADFEGTAVDTITVGSTDHKIFYALWEENTYTVVLNTNDGTGNSITTEPILYTGNLPTNTFERAGYTFKGWTDGVNTYSDLAAIADIVGTANDYNQVTLNAVWEVNKYTITYNLGSHAATETHNNPTEYSAELGADVVLEDLTPKSGFGFGGWYKNPEFTGEKVTTIACTDTTDYVLYAKWEHAGSYSIKETSVSGYKVTYTITRTIPDGAVPTDATQNVYVRTQNGTAYGTTADSSGQDKYHFIHSYAVLAFGPNDADTKTFTVTEKDDYLANYVTASYRIGNKARTYMVEIYKIENTTGGLAGTIGTGRVTRTMPVSSYELTTNMYRTVEKTLASGTVTVDDDGYGSNTSYTQNPASIFNEAASSAEEAYRDIVSTKYGYRITFDIREIDKGYQLIKLSTVTSSGTSRRGEYKLEAKGSQVASDFGRIITLPNGGSANQGDVVFNTVYESYTVYNDGGTKYAGIVAGNKIKIQFNADGDDDDDWQYRTLKLHVKVLDDSKPVAQYAAPMATTAYKKGDYAYISVIYNEPINSISGTPTLTLSSKLSEYFESPTYVNNGTGTNTLVFKVKAKKDISADEIQNVINLYLAFPVSGVGGNFSTNIGTVSATVKDILGN